ncbi:MAG: carbohydrate binding family 9 domain-containing protein, partial [Gemmatimonadales bacterium]
MIGVTTTATAILLVGFQQTGDQRPNGPPPSAAALAADTGAARHANGRTPPLASAIRVTPGSITLDGRLDDAAWTQAPAITEFTQTAPHEGTPATERTQVRIVYDDDAIYLGAWMFDSDPNGVRTQLARRDAFTEADQFQVAFDSYHDHVTSFVFGVNPSGVKSDILIGQDGFSWDDGWDPVWEVATHQDSTGWGAELRIPLSQLRFSKATRQVWGVNLLRRIQRKAEEVRFAYSPPSDRGYASFFAHLHGVEGLPQPRRLEALPYVTMRAARIDPGVPGNPFNDGSRELGAAGVDLKYGLTSSLTLD